MDQFHEGKFPKVITVSQNNVETGQLEKNGSVFLTWIILITTNIYLVNHNHKVYLHTMFHLLISTITQG